MKRNNLTTALLAGLAGAAGLASSAQALNLNPDGLGQVLIYPYYTVNDGNQTLISVVNTTDRVKAVKVRFLEGRNSKEVLDFNLYLSPFDVWTSALFDADETGPGIFITNDTSCTVPILRGQQIPFRNYQYSGSNRDHPASAAAVLSSLERTREGHLEMIEMGLLNTGTASTQLAEEATHVANTANPAAATPLNCNALVAAWTPPSGGWFLNGAANISLPAGGLFGNGAIVDVANGTMLSYAAEAIDQFYADSSDEGRLHAQPGSVAPDLRDADTSVGATRDQTVFFFNNGGASVGQTNFTSATQPATPDAVTTVFMHDTIYNEYNTEALLGAASEWVVTFPTKRYYVDDPTSPFTAIPPFSDPFRDDGSACDIVTIDFWNREEQTPGTAPGIVDVSPPPPDAEIFLPALCWEANVISFNQSQVANGTGGSSILGSDFGFNLNTANIGGVVFENGWMRLDFDDPTNGVLEQNALTTPGIDATLGTADDVTLFGLPATGFWAAAFVNSAAQPGLLANYSGAFRHRGSRQTSG
jgi:hypothetical protein